MSEGVQTEWIREKALLNVLVHELEAEVEKLKAELEVERAERLMVQHQLANESELRQRLSNAFELVQRGVALARVGEEEPVPGEGQDDERGTFPETLAPAEHLPPAPELEIAAAAPAADPRALELHEYCARLLHDIEAMYDVDVNAMVSPAAVVERLTANLRYGHELCQRFMVAPEGAATRIFEAEITRLLDAQASTAFGRHLSIAAHAALSPEASALASGSSDLNAQAS
jgi:hypothetical protein